MSHIIPENFEEFAARQGCDYLRVREDELEPGDGLRPGEIVFANGAASDGSIKHIGPPAQPSERNRRRLLFERIRAEREAEERRLDVTPEEFGERRGCTDFIRIQPHEGGHGLGLVHGAVLFADGSTSDGNRWHEPPPEDPVKRMALQLHFARVVLDRARREHDRLRHAVEQALHDAQRYRVVGPSFAAVSAVKTGKRRIDELQETLARLEQAWENMPERAEEREREATLRQIEHEHAARMSRLHAELMDSR